MPQTNSLIAYPFRPFFLLTGLYALLAVLAWVGFLFGDWPLPLGWSPLQWHSHEMLYGFVPAATAGFVLTAMTNWTGATPLAGGRLLALTGLWLAGRLAFWLAGWLPPWLVALVDWVFLPVLAIYVARVLMHHGNRRNLILVAILLVLALGNALMHLGFITGQTRWLNLGQSLALDVITLMMVVIAGRITPLFTINWLRNNGGDPAWVTQSVWVDRGAILSVLLLLLAELFAAPTWLTGSLALAAGALNGLRLWLWAGWRSWREPIVWILHLAYAWIALALLLRGFHLTLGFGSSSLWQHALAVGGMGSLIIGVMTRVALGHTGRAIALVPWGQIIYWAITAAALLRLAAANHWLDYRLGVTLSALAWILAFGLFVVLYWPILSRPRADGRPG